MTESTTSPPQFRSAAVARLAQMPVATLRIWEQRYQAVRPASSAKGHRCYSAADVQRVLLLRELTENGHAIGAIAKLETEHLLALKLTATTAALQRSAPSSARAVKPVLNLALIGHALVTPLQNLVFRQVQLKIRAIFTDLNEFHANPLTAAMDVLVWHAPNLQPETWSEILAAQQARRARLTAVVYRHASAATLAAAAQAGISCLREPADDDAWRRWVQEWADRLRPPADSPANHTTHPGNSGSPSSFPRRWESNPDHTEPSHASLARIPPRRYDDASLARLAARSSSLACECPRHMAQLLMTLASFESYSAACSNRDRADAQLHHYLHQVAASARAWFETALSDVVRHEGLTLSD